jgi:superfamily II DNA/RNA helicase
MSHVFCFDVPIHAEDYVHRIGRTGRAGLSGRSFMLAVPEDGRAVAAIVKLIGKEIPLGTIEGIEPCELEYEERRRGRSSRAKAGEGGHERRPAGAENRRQPEDQPKGRDRRARPSTKTATPVAAEGANVMRFPRAPQPRRPQPAARAVDEERKIVGFGDDLPAFLARRPRVVARP